LLHHDLGCRARVLPAEFETGRPALQIAGIDLALDRIEPWGNAETGSDDESIDEFAA